MNKIIELVLDTSSSMSALLDGEQRKIDVACKLIIHSLLPQFKNASQIGIRFFGGPCKMLGPHFTVSNMHLNDLVRHLKTQLPEPSGKTPLALAIQTAAEYLHAQTHTQKELYIISDGEETCGGSIEQAIDDVCSKGISCKMHIVSIGKINSTAQAQVDYISSRTGGRHVKLNNTQLHDTLFEEANERLMYTDISVCNELIDTKYLPEKEALIKNEITCVRDFILKQNLDVNYIPSNTSGPCCKLLIIEYYDDVSGLQNLLKAVKCLENCSTVTSQILILMNAWNASFYIPFFKPWVIAFKTFRIKQVAVKLDDFTGYLTI